MSVSPITRPQLLEENEKLRSSLAELKQSTQQHTAELQVLKKAEIFNDRTAKILEMIARESRHLKSMMPLH
jgi:hypothetical protein